MPANLLAVVSFVLISTFTPGPANISTASLSVLHGYKRTLGYILGLTSGFFLIVVLSGWISTTLLERFPALEPIVRYVGVIYILYLAFAILKASYTFEEGETKQMGFVHGFLMQFLNPKVIIFALTLFSAFLAPITSNLAILALALVLLTITAFCAMSTWALFGTMIKRYLHHPRAKVVVNVVLSLFLVYTAVELSGILSG